MRLDWAQRSGNMPVILTPLLLVVACFLAALVVLLLNDKTRKGTLVFLGVVVGVFAGFAASAC